MPSLRATARAVVRLSPVSITIADASALQRGERCRRGRLHRIGDGDERRQTCRRGHEDHGGAVAAQPFGVVLQRRDVDRRCRPEISPLPSATRRPSTMPITPLPAGASKPRPRPSAMPRSRRGGHDGGARADARCAFDARGKPQQRRSRRSLAPGRSRDTLGLPSVRVPVLSTTSVSTFSRRSSASAFLIRMPACAPRPTPP